MNQPLSVRYKSIDCGEVEIVYSESDNVWLFDLRGRSRKAESLAKAKQIINKPAPKEKTFKRTAAWVESYPYNEFVKVEVTSMAERGPGFFGEQYFWVIENGQQSKWAGSQLLADTPENIALITEYNRMGKQREEIKKQLKRFEPEV